MQTFIDLFAGCGGLSDGFEAHGGYRGIAHVEWERAPLETLRNRLEKRWRYEFVEQIALQFDIQQTGKLLSGGATAEGLDAGLGLRKIVAANGGVDFIIGGPPCQAYSIAGRIRDENGMHLDYRNYLFESYLEVVSALKPRVVVFENVPGMLSAAPGGKPIAARVRDAFQRAGYVIADDMRRCLVEMSDYGLPQMRRRLIIVGLRRRVFENRAEALLEHFYERALPRFHKKPGTVGSTIGDLPRLFPVDVPLKLNGRLYSHMPVNTDVADHEPRFHSTRDQKIFSELAEDALRNKKRYSSISALQRLYTERTGRKSAVHKYHVLKRDGQSNLIPAHLHKDGLRHIHYDPMQARSITVREAGLLQGFPMDFEFVGSQGARYKMIGNAVPPSFSERLASALFETFPKLRREI